MRMREVEVKEGGFGIWNIWSFGVEWVELGHELFSGRAGSVDTISKQELHEMREGRN